VDAQRPHEQLLNSILVVHGRYLDSDPGPMFQAARRQGLFIVAVSGNGYGPQRDPEHIHRRRCRVDGAPLDASFRDCFRRFWLDLCRSGRPAFHLLEPTRWPEHLISLYLVLKALQAGPEQRSRLQEAWRQKDEGAKRQFWSAAWQEYQAERQGSIDAWRSARLPGMDGASGSESLDLDGIDVPLACAAAAAALADRPG
jgi:hypothetical protein